MKAGEITNSGFTLLEVLITGAVLAAGISALLWAFSAGIFVSGTVRDVDLAMGIAQAKLENIYGTTGGVSDEERHNVSDDGFTDDVYSSKNFEVEITTDDGDPEEVEVTVYWEAKGEESSVTLTTLVRN